MGEIEEIIMQTIHAALEDVNLGVAYVTSVDHEFHPSNTTNEKEIDIRSALYKAGEGWGRVRMLEDFIRETGGTPNVALQEQIDQIKGVVDFVYRRVEALYNK